ncbi:ICP5 [Psittacid alphaherpesvirus 1]|uniref:Major capsid protein n=1 Tax=Psittacid herpesvirus 1 (isolate Amazon parrot/-/97-0001/1997) TaxID=670426 RepID=MCP_PSHV1|nr:major capsid protein [Psittacid alphaherpesvirus 1]Q6UDI4.1 RecName: Full=Major capsid protein; Short=MCP [Psittacid herpesvirus 1 Amazon parrot/1997]AAQ73726.1 ICP5 [Psittacid alphaherpesvirus 1]
MDGHGCSSSQAMCRGAFGNVATRPAPFPRSAAPFVVAGESLGALRDKCHAYFYDSFSSFTGVDCCYGSRFDILLGSYFNTITLSHFLETGLSIACICVKFPELKYAEDGIVQFVVANPMIARSDCEVPSRPSYTYVTKKWSRTTLTSSLSICGPALELLTGDALDGTEIANFSRARAMNQLARDLKLTLDSFERGTVHHVLGILIRKAPPMPLLQPLMAAMARERDMNVVARANILSAMKNAVREHLFFMDKESRGDPQDIARGLLSLINCTLPSVSDTRVTHVGPGGRPIDGVLVTTEAVKGLVTQALTLTASEATVPAMYGELSISGTNLVTALLMGKAIRNFNEAARNLLNFADGNVDVSDFPDIPQDGEDAPRTMSVNMSLVTVGDSLVAVEALERIYARTGVPYPLAGNVDLTFFFPLGLFKPHKDRYAIGGLILPDTAEAAVDGRLFPPTEMFFFDKDEQLRSVSFESSLGTVAHPIAHGIMETLQELSQEQWVQARPPAPMDFTIQRMSQQPPRAQMVEFLTAVATAVTAPHPSATLINRRSTDQFLSHTNPFLQLEVHPFYDVYRVAQDLQTPSDAALFAPVEPSTLAASRRLCNGDIPLPLSSADFRSSRGRQLAACGAMLSSQAAAAIETTLSDPNYPVAFYVIEACLHGDETLFLESQRLVAQCIESYWVSAGGLAFVNSFAMIMYITHNLSSLVNRNCHALYAEIVAVLNSMRAAVSRFTQSGDALLQHTQEELNHLLMDPAVFPPILYDCDPIIRVTGAYAARNITIRTLGERAPVVSTRDWPPQADFGAINITLNHGPPYTARGRADGGAHHDSEWTVLNKIFYYALLPALARGRCCSVGVEFEMVYNLINTTRLPANADDLAAPEANPLHVNNLAPDSFNALLHNSGVALVDAEALVAFIAAARLRQVAHTLPLRVSYSADPGFATIDSPNTAFTDGVLYNGLIMMNYPQYDATLVASRYFYALPVNGFYANRTIVEATHRGAVNLGEVPEDLPLVPTFLGAEAYRSIRAPSYMYCAKQCASGTASAGAVAYGLMAGYFKTSPVALTHQLKSGLHPGFALTVARQDRFYADQILFARRLSESYYMGAPTTESRAENNSLMIDIHQPRSHVDMGLGFTASRMPAKLNTVVTDMGSRSQNLFDARYPGQFRYLEVADFIASEITDDDSLAMPRARPPLMLPYEAPPLPPCLERGQRATCEFLITPVTADLKYFYGPANPRGRSSCVACMPHEDPSRDSVDRAMYDHTTPDAAFPSRATNNPWASQRFSLGDRMYNARRGFIVTSDFFSPLGKFMTPSRVEDKNRCLARLLRESATAVSSVTGNTEFQFVAPVGSNELITDPCAIFQEAYPILCASDKALFASYENPRKAVGTGARENHFAQYLIHDASPLSGVLKCNGKL